MTIEDDWRAVKARIMAEITPYEWVATCPVCRRSESITSSHEDDEIDPEVCTRCGNGIMRWRRVR